MLFSPLLRSPESLVVATTSYRQHTLTQLTPRNQQHPSFQNAFEKMKFSQAVVVLFAAGAIASPVGR